jgi:hypothetical protein
MSAIGQGTGRPVALTDRWHWRIGWHVGRQCATPIGPTRRNLGEVGKKSERDREKSGRGRNGIGDPAMAVAVVREIR